MQTTTSAHFGFSGLGLAPKLLEILADKGFVQPTPIQSQAIPVAIAGKDVMGIAQTGTGKTLAFGLPMLQSIARSKQTGLVVLPTRELALQVNDSLKNIGQSLGLKTAVLIGGESMNRQLASLRKNPHVIIATPGRLIDHLQQQTASLKRTGVLVLDEADRMLDMGFAPQLKTILTHVPKERQTMLFSATMPGEIVALANSYMRLPVRVEVAPAGTTASQVSQEIVFVDKMQKLAELQRLLKEHNGSTLVFTRTKFGAKKIARALARSGETAAELHSNRSLNQRLEALDGFKVGRYRVLVATDIAARGIDVTGIELVVNYDLPENPADYVHRIGRTGRAGRAGMAISFATPDQKRDVRDIERLIKKQLPARQAAALPAAAEPAYEAIQAASPRREPARNGRNNAFRSRRGPAPKNRPARGHSHSAAAGYRGSFLSRNPSLDRSRGWD
ncbi:MAG TPA: DEAD/DEAH box helicase [Patescibacteria group bacterium]|nr:DEAD/DEAH box helicase [Patescibacteria group bacterium]